jgi:omega-6 fatty acid desaturase (delta-12 desaturase)
VALLDAPPAPVPASGVPVDPGYAEMRKVKLGTVRAAFSPEVYERSNAKAFGWLAFDVALYAVLLAGVYVVPGILLKLLLGVLLGVAVALLFVWAHDAAHGALFGFTGTAEVLGSIAMLPSINMYRLWIYGHNKAHHGFTSFTMIDWIWAPKSPEQYQASSRWSRFVYRVERSLPGCAVHYVLRVWWPAMVTFRPPKDVRKRNHFTRSRLVTLAYVVVASVLAFLFAGGIGGVIAAVVVPWVVFTYLLAFAVYLHHTHPSLPFFDQRDEWCASIGQVACSTIVRTPKVFETLTHGILVHTPHHVDTKIPFYRLQRAAADLQPVVGDHMLEYRFTWSDVRQIFKTCQLYDYRAKTWYRFRDEPGRVAAGLEAA